MNLVKLIEKLVEHPQELAAFKQDPDAYIAKNSELNSHRQTLLGWNPFKEVGTVMHIKSLGGGSHTGTSHAKHPGAGSKSLSIDLDTTVTLRSLATNLVIETPDPIRCPLLPGSYIDITDQHKNFLLLLQYINPKNPNDPWDVIKIQAGDVNAMPSIDKYIFNSIVEISIDVDEKYGYLLLLLSGKDFVTTLMSGSKYNPTTGGIKLIFRDRRGPNG